VVTHKGFSDMFRLCHPPSPFRQRGRDTGVYLRQNWSRCCVVWSCVSWPLANKQHPSTSEAVGTSYTELFSLPILFLYRQEIVLSHIESIHLSKVGFSSRNLFNLGTWRVAISTGPALHHRLTQSAPLTTSIQYLVTSRCIRTGRADLHVQAD